MPTTTRPLHPADLVRLRVERPTVRIVDVRTPGEFARRHIPGSANVPLPELGGHRAALGDGTPVVLVCESGRRAEQAEATLRRAGLDEVHVLAGGVAAWDRAGHGVTRLAAEGDAPWSLERQVRLVAGGLVAGAVAVSVAWPPARFAAGAVGFGLVVAATTDTCAMGNLLARLPHNRRTADGCDLDAVAEQVTGTTEARS